MIAPTAPHRRYDEARREGGILSCRKPGTTERVPPTSLVKCPVVAEEPDQLVHYQDADIALTGVLYGHDHEHELPGILLIHGGAGLDEHARQQGRRWAALGYVVFVCDMYGDG